MFKNILISQCILHYYTQDEHGIRFIIETDEELKIIQKIAERNDLEIEVSNILEDIK